jgi:hypothetical protein
VCVRKNRPCNRLVLAIAGWFFYMHFLGFSGEIGRQLQKGNAILTIMICHVWNFMGDQ